MQISGLFYDARLVDIVGFPHAEGLGPDAREEAIKTLVDRHGTISVKPTFKEEVGKKGAPDRSARPAA